MVRLAVAGNAAPTRVTHAGRRLFTNKKRTVARYRRASYKRTPEECANLAAQRVTRKTAEKEGFQEVRDAVDRVAERLEGLGQHSATYMRRALLQHSLIKSKQRRVSPWNAFQRLRMKEINDRELNNSCLPTY